MKKLLLAFSFFLVLTMVTRAQTAKELIGKWKLVSYKGTNGDDKDIKSTMGSDEVYQVFMEDGKFQGIVGEKVNNGKWKLSDDDKKLKISVGLMSADFTIDYFDAGKRTISSKSVGTLSYEKVN